MDEDRFEFRDVILALLTNSLSEAVGGHCQRITIELTEDAVQVTDDGRGLPLHAHPQSGRSLLEVIMTGPRRGPRNTLARLTSSCLWVDVEIRRDGELWAQRFEYGQPTGGAELKGLSEGSGTAIACSPVNGEPPSFVDLRDYVRTLADDGLPSRVEITVRDAREAIEDTVVIDASQD